MSDLTDFLLAQIAKDEETARAAKWGTPWSSDGSTVYETTATLHGEVVADECWSRDIAEHIARHDPAHVLADCEAKRRIIELAQGLRYRAGQEIVTALALPYATHPDYREEWRP